MKFSSIIAALAGIAAIPALALAQANVSTAFTYQGLLTDGGSRATAIYDIQFRLFDSTGTQQGPLITSNNKSVIDGLLTQDLDFGVQYQGRQLFLDIRVRPGASAGAYTALTPRQELTATPYAQGLRLPYVGTVSSAAPAVALSNSGGPDLAIGGDATFGSTVENGNIQMRNTAANPLAIFFERGGTGGAGAFFTTTGSDYFRIEPDVSGPTGGFFEFRNGNGSAAMQIDGDRAGGNARIDFFGASNVTFDLTTTGNPAVVLPTDAVSSTEIFDEPGATRVGSDPSVALSNTGQTIIQQSTINCPAAGFVLAIGVCDTSYNHTAGVAAFANYGVSNSPTSLPAYQDVTVAFPGGSAVGIYDIPTMAQNLIPVSAGPNTIYFLGTQGNGTAGAFRIFDATLTLVYLPTSYGSVAPVINPPAPITDGTTPSVPNPFSSQTQQNWTPQASAAERERSIADNLARIQREMADLQKQLAELKASASDNR